MFCLDLVPCTLTFVLSSTKCNMSGIMKQNWACFSTPVSRFRSNNPHFLSRCALDYKEETPHRNRTMQPTITPSHHQNRSCNQKLFINAHSTSAVLITACGVRHKSHAQRLAPGDDKESNTKLAWFSANRAIFWLALIKCIMLTSKATWMKIGLCPAYIYVGVF